MMRSTANGAFRFSSLRSSSITQLLINLSPRRYHAPVAVRPGGHIINKDDDQAAALGNSNNNNGERVVVYDQFYDPLTGAVEKKERNLVSVPDTARIFTSSRGWVGLVDPSRDCSLYLANLLDYNRTQPIKLPSIETLPCVKQVVRRYNALSRSAADVYVHTYTIISGGTWNQHSADDVAAKFIKSIALSGDPSNEYCTAMLVFGDVVSFCKPSIDNQWERELDPDDTDLIGSHLKLYTNRYQPVFARMDDVFYNLYDKRHKRDHSRDKEGLELWDVSRNYSLERCVFKNREIIQAARTYLVVDDQLSGARFLVYKFYSGWGTQGGVKFDVVKMDAECKSEERVSSIGEAALFVGPYECFVLSVKDFPQLQPDSIYFIDNDCKDSGIYSLKDGTIVRFNEPWEESYGDYDRPDQKIFWLRPSDFN